MPINGHAQDDIGGAALDLAVLPAFIRIFWMPDVIGLSVALKMPSFRGEAAFPEFIRHCFYRYCGNKGAFPEVIELTVGIAGKVGVGACMPSGILWKSVLLIISTFSGVIPAHHRISEL